MKKIEISFNSIMSIFATFSMSIVVLAMMFLFGTRVSSAIYEKIPNGVNIVVCAIINIVFVVATVFIIEVIIVWTSSMSMSLEKMSLGRVVAESKLGRFGVIMTAILGALAIGMAVLCATEDFEYDDFDEYEINEEYAISTEIDKEVYE